MSDQLYLWPDEHAGGRLSWSLSRDRRLRDCLRKYYLQHFGSRGGGQAGASGEAREAYVLKHLRTRHMWVGEVVHEMIELALAAIRRGDAVPVEAIVERGTRRMRAQYAESLQGVYRERPHQACGLSEHEYREDISRDEWKRQRDRMEACVRAFFELELLRDLKAAPPWRWLAVESLASFELEGATIVVKPDFAWRDQQDRVVVVDWKTGKRRGEEDWLQVAVYGLFARRAWGLGAQPLMGRLVYLESGESLDVELLPADLERAEAFVKSSVAHMRGLHSDAAAGMQARFPLTEDRSLCLHCNFRRLCGRQQPAPA